MQMIPPIGLVNRAFGINDDRIVVGETEYTGFGDKGWVWTAESGTRMLGVLIDPAEDMNILTAHDINNEGQIIALAYDNVIGGSVPILLTPVGANPADFDGDGVVGPFDLAVLLGNWGAV